MKIAPKAIILVRDANGVGPAVFDALQATPGSDLTRDVSSFELLLDKYGLEGRKASGDVINFTSHEGFPQVSVLLLPAYEPPVAACAVNEIFASIKTDNSSDLLTVIVSVFLPSLRIVHEFGYHRVSNNKIDIFGVGIGQETESTKAVLAGIHRPPSLQINCETLACLLKVIQVLNMPTVIVGTTVKHQTGGAQVQGLERIKKLGELLADRTGLCFSADKICWREEKQRATEPWRALYG